MKDTEKYLKNLLRKTINETYESKADELMEKIKKMEMDEAYGDEPGLGDNTPDFDFSKFKKNIDTKEYKRGRKYDSMFPPDYVFRQALDDLEDEEEEYDDDDISGLFNEGEMCEQCGGMTNEGECMECGSIYEGIYNKSGKFPPKQSFDYVEEEEDIEGENEIPSTPQACISASRDAIGGDEVAKDFAKSECMSACKAMDSEKYEQLTDEEKTEFDSKCKMVESLNEGKKLVGNQKKLDRNKNNRIDAEDFKLLRKSKKTSKKDVEEEEMEEGNAFTYGLSKTKKGGSFKLGNKTIKDTSDYDMKESVIYHITDSDGDIIKLTENEVVDLIEKIVNEQKTPGLKTIGKPKGLTTYEKAHKASGKENQEYFKSFEKKMKDYLKDGSKGKFDMNPKMFPQGNGELGKMDKKAFKMTDDLEDFNYEIAGQNFPVPDAIDYNEEWMEKLFKGDSMTGNAPGGNALESKTNDRFNKMRKKNTLKKLKDQSYKRVPQPVFNEKSGDGQGKGLNIKLESVENKKTQVLNEEFDRMKELFKYNRKTQ